MLIDPIADLLTRMRNSLKARQPKTIVPHSKMKISILNVLKQYHYVHDFKVVKNGTFQEIEIHFEPQRNFELKRVSKPGQRIYIKKEDIKPVCNGYGIAILSTSQGVMSAGEAKKNGFGGELLCEIW